MFDRLTHPNRSSEANDMVHANARLSKQQKLAGIGREQPKEARFDKP
jgi:hypothetical protein